MDILGLECDDGKERSVVEREDDERWSLVFFVVRVGSVAIDLEGYILDDAMDLVMIGNVDIFVDDGIKHIPGMLIIMNRE